MDISVVRRDSDSLCGSEQAAKVDFNSIFISRCHSDFRSRWRFPL